MANTSNSEESPCFVYCAQMQDSYRARRSNQHFHHGRAVRGCPPVPLMLGRKMSSRAATGHESLVFRIRLCVSGAALRLAWQPSNPKSPGSRTSLVKGFVTPRTVQERQGTVLPSRMSMHVRRTGTGTLAPTMGNNGLNKKSPPKRGLFL